MADEEPTAPETTETADVDQPDLAAEVEKWKALSRKNEKEAKANAAAARRLEEIENASKSEAERLAARVEEAESRAAAHEATALRLQVAFEKGLTPAQAKRLVGASREELEADADDILRDFPATSSRPRGDVGQGGRGKPVASDPRDVFASLIQTRQ